MSISVEFPPVSEGFAAAMTGDTALRASVADAVHTLTTPYIGPNGNWFEWDSETAAYADSGKSAAGPRGEKGDKGDKGDRGATGPVGVQGMQGVGVISAAVVLVSQSSN